MTNPQTKGVAAVVGVGAGLGAALARRFAAGFRGRAHGARRGRELQHIADEITATGGRAFAISVDEQGGRDSRRLEGPAASSATSTLLYNAAMRPLALDGDQAEHVREHLARERLGAFLCAQQWCRRCCARDVAPSSSPVRRREPARCHPAAWSRPSSRCAAPQVMRATWAQSVHVAINIDGAIDMPFIHKLRPDLKPEDSAARRRSPRPLACGAPGSQRLDANRPRTLQGVILGDQPRRPPATWASRSGCGRRCRPSRSEIGQIGRFEDRTPGRCSCRSRSRRRRPPAPPSSGGDRLRASRASADRQGPGGASGGHRPASRRWSSPPRKEVPGRRARSRACRRRSARAPAGNRRDRDEIGKISTTAATR